MSFILLDQLLRLAETQVIAQKTFKSDDPIFRDHFPGSALVPGTLLLEGMAQSCGWWIAWKSGHREKSVLLLADRIQFRHWVKPGEAIRYEGNVLQSGGGRARFSVQAGVNGNVVARAELSFAVFGLNDPSGPFQSKFLGKWMEEKFLSLGGPVAEQDL